MPHWVLISDERAPWLLRITVKRACKVKVWTMKSNYDFRGTPNGKVSKGMVIGRAVPCRAELSSLGHSSI